MSSTSPQPSPQPSPAPPTPSPSKAKQSRGRPRKGKEPTADSSSSSSSSDSSSSTSSSTAPKKQKEKRREWTFNEVIQLVDRVASNGKNWGKVLIQMQDESHLLVDLLRSDWTPIRKKWNDLANEQKSAILILAKVWDDEANFVKRAVDELVGKNPEEDDKRAALRSIREQVLKAAETIQKVQKNEKVYDSNEKLVLMEQMKKAKEEEEERKAILKARNEKREEMAKKELEYQTSMAETMKALQEQMASSLETTNILTQLLIAELRHKQEKRAHKKQKTDG